MFLFPRSHSELTWQTDSLAILIGIVQNQHYLQQQMAKQIDRILENFPLIAEKRRRRSWIDRTVNREAVTRNCPEIQKLQLVKGALREIAT